MENRRFILLALLGVVLFFMYQAWQKDYAGPALPPVAVPAAATVLPSADAPAVPAPQLESAVPVAAPVASVVTIETDVLRAEINTRGGELRKLWLKQYPETREKPDQPLALLDDQGTRWFVLQSGLAGHPQPWASSETVYTSTAPSFSLTQGSDTLDVTLSHTSADGYRVDKTFRFARNSYQIGLSQTLVNQTAAPLSANAYVRLQRLPYSLGSEPPFVALFSGVGLYEAREGKDGYRFRKESFEDLGGAPLELQQAGGWLAMLQHYFIAAILPPAGEALSFSAGPGKEKGYRAQYLGPAVNVAPGAQHAFETQLYLGPKLQDSIGDLAPGLELTLDYGILTALAKPLFWILSKFHALTGNWGWAIVLLTLVVKAAMYKLSEAQYRSMAKMKKFGPRIQDMKERFGDDREKMQKAMMDLYKKEGFNPLAGCWPLLVQMPVFLALYWVLLESVELRQAPFLLWIQDLAAPDPFYVLPVLFGASMWFQQKLSGQAATMDPMQQKVMNVMPIMLTAFFAFFQSGLVLYWFVSNVIGIAQQWLITRLMETEEAAKRQKA